jgi:N,N'-diacetyllegionaminate synthase
MIKIIAEIGWNHMGDMALAKRMIVEASNTGATHAKFQSWSVSRLKPGSWDTDGRREIYEKAQLTLADHKYLKSVCDEYNIEFMSSVFCLEDIDVYKRVTTKCVKIPSFESRNYPLIKKCMEVFDKVYISVGTTTWDEVKELARVVDINKTCVMHCVSTYPLDPKNANILKLKELNKLFKWVGYSDHMQGVESAKVALEFGIHAIEKHFTVDNTLPGRDNKFAILPSQLNDLSEYIKLRNDMMIDQGLDFQECESDSRTNYAGRFNG